MGVVLSSPAVLLGSTKAGQNETINTEADSSFLPAFFFFFCFLVVLPFCCPEPLLCCFPYHRAVYKSAWPSALLEVAAFVP